MLRYLGYGLRDYAQTPLLPMRREGWEFQAVTAGQSAPISDISDSPELHSTTLWVFPPRHLHGWTGRKGKPCRIFVAHFDVVSPALHTGDVFEVKLTRHEAHRLDRMSDELAPHYHNPHSQSHLHIEKCKNELTLLALKQTESVPVRYDQQRVEAAIAWYHQNMSKRVTVNDMADACYVSVAHLRRLFVRYRKKPPQKVMREMQIHRAQELMMTTQLPLSEIASACGFSCQSVFSRSYEGMTGRAPSAWRHALHGSQA